MREIKFRGWHTQAKKMFSAEEMAVDQLTLLPTGSFINVSGGSTKLSVIYPQDKFIPLQYTGLKDKNGVEIYEGDIIKTAFEHYPLMSIEYDAPVWVMKANNAEYDDFLSNYSGFDIEVIGNIYENPELVKV